MAGDDSQSYEMLWNCAFCGQKGLLGVTHRHCPGCGAAQDPAARYFPPPGQEIAVENHVFVGVDKLCPSCQRPNGAKASFCGGCGAALDGAREVALKSDAPPPSAPRPAAPAPRPKARGTRGKALAILGIVVALIAVFVLYKKEKQVVVDGHAWARTIDVEELYEASERSECAAMPERATLDRRWSEARTRKVQSGETCREECTDVRRDRGDGSFAKARECRQVCEPRYVDQRYEVAMCAFRIAKWKKTRAAKAEGKAREPAPRWPELALAAGKGPQQWGKEREGKRVEVYDLAMKDDQGKVFHCKLERQELWTALKPREAVTIDFDLLGNPRCDTIRRPGEKRS